jgi:hypothetical protein
MPQRLPCDKQQRGLTLWIKLPIVKQAQMRQICRDNLTQAWYITHYGLCNHNSR